MTEQQKEIETIKLRTYTFNLSDADVKRIAKKAGAYGISVSELLENFIADLVDGTFTNGSDERMYAGQWAERCFAFQQEKNLIQYLYGDFEYDFSTLENILSRIESTKAAIEKVENNIKNPDDSWKDLVYHKYNDDMTSYKCVPCYNSFEEYVANRKQELSDYKEEFEEAGQELKDFKDYFEKYMDGESYNWDDEVKNAMKWYAENISSKLD